MNPEALRAEVRYSRVLAAADRLQRQRDPALTSAERMHVIETALAELEAIELARGLPRGHEAA